MNLLRALVSDPLVVFKMTPLEHLLPLVENFDTRGSEYLSKLINSVDKVKYYTCYNDNYYF
jgi:hypothetical protein